MKEHLMKSMESPAKPMDKLRGWNIILFFGTFA